MSEISSMTSTFRKKELSASPLFQSLHEIRELLRKMDESEAAHFFQLEFYKRFLKTTISLCPECLEHVPALIYTLQGQVFIQKKCSIHGVSGALLENDENFYYLSNKDKWGRCFAKNKIMDFPAFEGSCCGGGSCGTPAKEDVSQDFIDQLSNKSCTVLVEVTNACNLSCAVCYSDAKGDRKMPLENFQKYILELIDQKVVLDSVQLTGGEAILHPEFWKMMDFLYSLKQVKKIYLPTNGIAFAKRDFCERLVPFRDKIMVLLQFDSASVDPSRALRNADTLAVRDKAIQFLGELNIQMQLTMTITMGVNDHEIGWIVDTGMKHPHVKVIALQPVTYSGRYDLKQDSLKRMTLSDVVKSIAAQVHKKANDKDFVPIPCSHPNCGWITLFIRRFGLTLNIVKHVDLDRVMNQVANRTLLSTKELQSVVGTKQQGVFSRVGAWVGRKLIRSTDVFGIAIKPFMDKHTYDLDRISACCHHLLDTKGKPVSFCEYNARIRPKDSWDAFPKV
jgi:uncharacterized radical SAM superfamily Fe-S cluster-containing enzyme